MYLVSSSVWASEPVFTEFTANLYFGYRIRMRQIISKKNPYLDPKNQFLICTTKLLQQFWLSLCQKLGLRVLYNLVYKSIPYKYAFYMFQIQNTVFYLALASKPLTTF